MTLLNRKAAITATAMKMAANIKSAQVTVFPAAQLMNPCHQVRANSLMFTSVNVA